MATIRGGKREDGDGLCALVGRRDVGHLGKESAEGLAIYTKASDQTVLVKIAHTFHFQTLSVNQSFTYNELLPDHFTSVLVVLFMLPALE